MAAFLITESCLAILESEGVSPCVIKKLRENLKDGEALEREFLDKLDTAKVRDEHRPLIMQLAKRPCDTDCDTLRAQLAELNKRSRLYSSRLWQVPLAYVGVVVLILSGIVDKAHIIRVLGLILAGFLGISVRQHLQATKDGQDRAVQWTKWVEERLKSPVTVKGKEHKPESYVEPLFSMVTVSAFLSLISGLFYLLYLVLSCLSQSSGERQPSPRVGWWPLH